MKVLHISDQPPGYLSGGQLGILQFSYAWTHAVDQVDYIGPSFNNKEIKSWYNQCYFLDWKPNIIQKIWSLCHLQFDRKYLSWKKMDFAFARYDLIYIDFTKMDYAIKDIKKSGYKGKVIVRAHNVEADFFRVNFLSRKSIMTFLKYIVAKPRERYMVRTADCILAITEQDRERLVELYSIPSNKIEICPVGINIPLKEMKFKTELSQKLKCLITGTLSFGPNADATLWFIDKVYPLVKDIADVTIAGYKPNNDLIRKCKENNIKLVDTPETMRPLFEGAEMFCAPIFEGGGMKVKIAEAMSYGLPIVTTTHGAIGYDLINRQNCYISDTAEGFAEAIKEYISMNDETRIEFLRDEWNNYCDKFSLYAIRDRMIELIRRFS